MLLLIAMIQNLKEIHNSESAKWKEAVKKDDEIYARYNIGTHRVYQYAKTNNQEDFAECVRSYYNYHDFFKEAFPNRATYIREIAKLLSGHFKTP